MPVKLSVLGAGAWGTALAAAACARNPTLLWARDPTQAAALRATRCNDRYLPGIALPAALAITADHDAALRHAAGGLLIIATPMAGLRERLAALPPAQPVLWLSKGFEAGTGALGHEVAAEVAPHARCGVLSGPSFALEVARGQPTALVAASTDAALAEAAVHALHGEQLRIYTSGDPVGVEVGGALKNVLAIATGLLDGLAARADAPGTAPLPGLNARAALLTRGLAEMTRLGLALGAQAQTFMGLSGLGDLVLTATGDLSRNRNVGLRLARGQPLARILRELGHVAEGVYSAATALRRAQACGVELPITAAVVDVLDGRIDAQQALQQLMSRDARSEQPG